jgi:hypothetical protein
MGLLLEVVQEFRRGPDAGHQQMFASPSAGYVEQLSFCVVNIF